MAATLTAPERSTPVNRLDDVRLRPAKAALASDPDRAFTDLVKRTAAKLQLSQKELATELGGIDKGQLHRELESGRLSCARLSQASPAFLAELGSVLLETYGTARVSKRDLALRQLPQFAGLLTLVAEALTEDR